MSTVLESHCRLRGTPLGSPKIRSLDVVVVGAGALGNEVCRLLGQIGVRQVSIVDGDGVEDANLPFSFLLRRSTGGFKSQALADFAAELFPEVGWRSIPKWFCQVGWEHLSAAGLIFSCVDNDTARIEIAAAACAMDRPVMDAGLAEDGSLRGSLAWYPGSAAACAGCLLSPGRLREALGAAFEPGPSCSRGAVAGAGAGSPAAAALVAAWQVDLGLRRWLSLGTGGAAVWRLDLEGPYRADVADAAPRPGCPFHTGCGDRLPGPSGETFQAWFDRTGHADCELLLDWPVALRAVCRRCAAPFEPRVPLGVLASRCRCPACGAWDCAPAAVLRSVHRNMPEARCTPAELGLPERHLYRVRGLGKEPGPWS